MTDPRTSAKCVSKSDGLRDNPRRRVIVPQERLARQARHKRHRTLGRFGGTEFFFQRNLRTSERAAFSARALERCEIGTSMKPMRVSADIETDGRSIWRFGGTGRAPWGGNRCHEGADDLTVTGRRLDLYDHWAIPIDEWLGSMPRG